MIICTIAINPYPQVLPPLGAGIMTHHVGYTLLFEQALQVVDPTVSIPYWEYTIDGEDNNTRLISTCYLEVD